MKTDETAIFAPHETRDCAMRRMAELFKRAGIAFAYQDARYLLQGILEVGAENLLRDGNVQIGAKAHDIAEAAQRRAAREPVSRILGWREFYGRRFAITSDVLDPRPDTETLVDLALELAASRGQRDTPLAIADIGTGSGAIIATLLAELSNAQGTGSDVSAEALAVARGNAAALGVADRLTLVQTSLLEGIAAEFDIIVSNPPYIPTADIETLEPEVRDFDPRLALDGGASGLRIYREIANRLHAAAVGAPHIVLEVGAGAAQNVVEIFKNGGFELICQRKDLGGHVRAVAFRLRR